MVKTECCHRIYLVVVLGALVQSCLSNPLARSLSTPSLVENETTKSSTEDIDYDKIFHSVYDDDSSAEDLPVDLMKRLAKNYLRFGRDGGPPMIYGEANLPLNEEEKRAARNFLRFGRGPEKNFLRFGKSSPLAFGLGVEDQNSDHKEEVKRGNPRNFLRFGRDNLRNFIRFGRASGRNFIRFGRSVESQMADCEECNTDIIPTGSTPVVNTKEDSDSSHPSRTKRSVPAFYDDMLFMAPTPSWVDNVGHYGPSVPVSSEEYTANGQKRARSRSFLRYGRDPLELHFLRFGKRSMSEESDESPSSEEPKFDRVARARAVKNFLRFG